jgi:hypothetical protein
MPRRSWWNTWRVLRGIAYRLQCTYRQASYEVERVPHWLCIDEEAQIPARSPVDDVPTPAFESGLPGRFLRATLPSCIGRVEHTLQRMTGDVELFAMLSKQIVEGFTNILDIVFGIQFDLANGPIPYACELEQPCVELGFL